MTKQTHQQYLILDITITETVTVIPRIVQILSRRGFIVKKLTSTPHTSKDLKLHMTVQGPLHWHNSISSLLLRLIDVHAINIRECSND